MIDNSEKKTKKTMGCGSSTEPEQLIVVRPDGTRSHDANQRDQNNVRTHIEKRRDEDGATAVSAGDKNSHVANQRSEDASVTAVRADRRKPRDANQKDEDDVTTVSAEGINSHEANQRDKNGEIAMGVGGTTPLMSASRLGQLDAVHAIIETSNLDAQDEVGTGGSIVFALLRINA